MTVASVRRSCSWASWRRPVTDVAKFRTVIMRAPTRGTLVIVHERELSKEDWIIIGRMISAVGMEDYRGIAAALRRRGYDAEVLEAA